MSGFFFFEIILVLVLSYYNEITQDFATTSIIIGQEREHTE